MDFGELTKNYKANFLREGIIIPPPDKFKIPMIIECLPDDQNDEREKQAVMLPVKVMKYNEEKKDLVPDIELANSLAFGFSVDPNNSGLSEDGAQKAIEDAKLISEIDPDHGTATASQPYAIYRIYASALAEAQSDNVKMHLTISCEDENIKDLVIKSRLKLKIDLKGLIRQFIEYPKGTHIGALVELGDISKYFAGIDRLKGVEIITPELLQAKADAIANKKFKKEYHFNPFDNKIYLLAMPESIREFVLVQSIHHEIAHSIEASYGDDYFAMTKSDQTSFGERHTYHIQYISDIAKSLADLEREGEQGITSSINRVFADVVHKYYEIFFNADNLVYPVNQGEIKSWFGAWTPNQHYVMDQYRHFGLYCKNTNLPREFVSQVEEVFGLYFPADLKGEWQEVGGAFDGAFWKIEWSRGRIGDKRFAPKHNNYEFATQRFSWTGGNLLQMIVDYEVLRKTDGKKAHLTLYADGGTFDNMDYHYPKVDKFILKWTAEGAIGSEILEKNNGVEVELVRK